MDVLSVANKKGGSDLTGWPLQVVFAVDYITASLHFLQKTAQSIYEGLSGELKWSIEKDFFFYSLSLCDTAAPLKQDYVSFERR